MKIYWHVWLIKNFPLHKRYFIEAKRPLYYYNFLHIKKMFYISHHLSITYVFRTKKANCIRYKIIKPSGFCKQIILNNLFSAICNFLITGVKVIFMYMVHTGGVHHINISPDPHVYGPLTETLVSTFLIEFGRR